MIKILILGGYGHFGQQIVAQLAHDKNIQLVIAGRRSAPAQRLAETYRDATHPPETAVIDIHSTLAESLARIAPDLVIHTCGPFQGQDYAVARACITQGCHYIDLADARDFVTEITNLDTEAKARGVSIISGASSVPTLTAAVIDAHLPAFKTLDRIDYAISTAQRAKAGIATTAAILGYAGKPFTTLIDGQMQTVYGWQGIVQRRFADLGLRWLGYCDVPDLALFPVRYPDLRHIAFRAGLEIPFLHIGLWLLSFAVRLRMLHSLAPFATQMQGLADRFDRFGSGNSGFRMEMSGVDAAGLPISRQFTLIARAAQGLRIPVVPAIWLARRLAQGHKLPRGASPCIGMLTIGDYLDGLRGLDITVHRDDVDLSYSPIPLDKTGR